MDGREFKGRRKKQISIDVFTQDLEDSITDLEKRIEKLEEGFREIELKNRDKNGEIYKDKRDKQNWIEMQIIFI